MSETKTAKITHMDGTTIQSTRPRTKLTKEQIASMRAKDREPVKGVLRFHECPGAVLTFYYLKYKGDEIERYDLADNEIYTIPLGVAKWLNTGGWYPVHHYQMNENGTPVQRIGQKVRRYSFESLEFVDVEDLTPVGSKLVTVENLPII